MTDQTPTGETNIERVVMRRVRLIRLLAFFISTATLAALTFIAALWGIGKEVWVARVLQNTPHNLADLPNFYFAAFGHTHFIVQVLLILTLISFIFLARETAKLIAPLITPARP